MNALRIEIVLWINFILRLVCWGVLGVMWGVMFWVIINSWYDNFVGGSQVEKSERRNAAGDSYIREFSL